MSRSTLQVQGTSDSCTLSKYSMAKKGYLFDPYVQYLVSKIARRAPLINIGYFSRAIVIKEVLTSFLSFVNNKPAQIVSCGAGFDSNYFVLVGTKAIHPNVIYVEVDYPDIIKRKKHCISNSPQLSSLLDEEPSCEISGINGKQYKLIGCDLKDRRELAKKFKKYGLDFSIPTLFFSECAITYMMEKDSSQLIKWVADAFENASFVTYEQIHPNDGFGIVMINHFKKLYSPLLSVASFPDISSQRERYLDLGWSSCTAKTIMDTYFQILSKEDQVKILSLEPFDEFEEWHSKCCHYFISVATKGVLEKWKPLDKINSFSSDTYFHLKFNWELKEIDFQRYHHASGVLNEDEVLVIGGFGSLSNGGNSRLSEISFVKLNSLNGIPCVTSIPVEDSRNIELARVLHSCNVTANGNIIVFGGRTSPLKPLSDCLVISLKTTSNPKEIKSAQVEKLKFSQITPAPRWRFTALLIDYNEHEELAVFGGRANCRETLGDLWLLKIKDLTWQEEIFQNGPEPRFSHSAANWKSEKKMLISGGLRQDGSPLKDIWSWDYVHKEWKCIEFSLEYDCLLCRYGHSSLVIADPNGGDLLLMVGGLNIISGQQLGVGVFHLQKKIFLEYSLPVHDPEYPILLFNHTCHELPGKNEVLIIGGGGTCFSFGTSFNRYLIKINLSQFFT